MLSKHSVSGNERPQSLQRAEPMWTDPCLIRVKLVRVSWIPLKKKLKSCRRRMIRPTYHHNPCMRWESHHHHQSKATSKVQPITSYQWSHNNRILAFYALTENHKRVPPPHPTPSQKALLLPVSDKRRNQTILFCLHLFRSWSFHNSKNTLNCAFELCIKQVHKKQGTKVYWHQENEVFRHNKFLKHAVYPFQIVFVVDVVVVFAVADDDVATVAAAIFGTYSTLNKGKQLSRL